MSNTYGLPIQGSKNKLAERIINVLPSATHLYDLFCGGGAISHCALLSGKWKYVHLSDLTDTVMLIKDVFEGKIPDNSEWISREEFFRRRDTDPWIRLIWSFAGNQNDYIYSREKEPVKKAIHEMIYADTPDKRRIKAKKMIEALEAFMQSQINTPPEKYLSNLGRMQHMERIPPPTILHRVNELQSYERWSRVSNMRSDFKDARRHVGTSPFLKGSMTAASVITER